jgi:Domain of unknown function (DUF4406)
VKRPVIYVAGKMTGLPEFNFPAFNAAAKLLRDMGFTVENPAEIAPIEGHPWEAYMRIALVKMLTCEAIVLLPGWERSRGANIERHLAIDLGMPVWLLSDFIEAHSA